MPQSQQTILRWASLGPESKSSWAWREALQAMVPTAPWEQLSVSQGTHALQVISTDSAASRWLADQQALFTGGCLEEMGPKRLVQRRVSACSKQTMYRVPMVVVAKAGERWAGLEGAALSDDQRVSLALRFSAQVAKMLVDFGSLPAQVGELAANLNLRLVEDGEARPIRMNSGGGGGRGGFALGRKGVVISSPWRLEGEFQIGRLKTVGYGRMFVTE
jgi:hypothetical protein